MFPTSSLLQLPRTLKPHPSPFFHGSPSLLPFPTRPSSLPPHQAHSPLPLTVRAMRNMQGRVVCATNDKTVAVEVVRLAPHPKYKRRVRKKKTYQAHDPDNLFKVGDLVQLEKSRPISKNKAFVALPVAPRNAPKPAEAVPQDLGLPLESQAQ
uniref:30S ribosomal protein S17, chloroplastic n=1 Tax=Anthurium amnicola TaxID=1678845 RepID=A0A1D1YP38_9ARAE